MSSVFIFEAPVKSMPPPPPPLSPGFPPTFGPCYVNFYGAPREFNDLRDLYEYLNKGVVRGGGRNGRGGKGEEEGIDEEWKRGERGGRNGRRGKGEEEGKGEEGKRVGRKREEERERERKERGGGSILQLCGCG